MELSLVTVPVELLPRSSLCTKGALTGREGALASGARMTGGPSNSGLSARLISKGVSMLSVLLLFLGLGSSSQPVPVAEEGPPTLVVQVVDPVWIPLPDSEVTVKPADGKGASKSAHADENGYARFWVETGVEYTIEAKTHGFNKKTMKHVFIAKPKQSLPTAHVQIKLQPSGPFTYNK